MDEKTNKINIDKEKEITKSLPNFEQLSKVYDICKAEGNEKDFCKIKK